MADGPPQLRLIPGGGEIVGTLEQVLEQAKEGKLVGVVVCGISDEDGGSSGWVWAHRDGISPGDGGKVCGKIRRDSAHDGQTCPPELPCGSRTGEEGCACEGDAPGARR